MVKVQYLMLGIPYSCFSKDCDEIPAIVRICVGE